MAIILLVLKILIKKSKIFLEESLTQILNHIFYTLAFWINVIKSLLCIVIMELITKLKF